MMKRNAGPALWLAPALSIVALVAVLVLLQASAGAEAFTQAASVSLSRASATMSSHASLPDSEAGWQTIFTETFESGIGPGWTVTDTSTADGGEYAWGAGPLEPGSSVTAAWCVGGGADGDSLTPGVDDYPEHVDAWLIHGPVTLTEVWDAYAEFSWWMEGDGSDRFAPYARSSGVQTLETATAPDEGDWLGWCVLTDPGALESAECSYVASDMGVWMRGAIPLGAHLPATRSLTSTVWIAFRFLSDGDGRTGRGAFVDDVALRVNRGYKTFIPLAASMPTIGPTNLVLNGGFEERDEAYRRVRALPTQGDVREENEETIFTPPGWLTWYRDEPGTWDRPQVTSTIGASGETGGRRVRQGENATLLFTSHQNHDAGFFQQVEVRPGAQVRVEAWAHAWSNDGGGPAGQEEDEGWSEGAGFDCFYAEEGEEGLTPDLENVTFWLGIDPTGGVDPDAETVVWGAGAHIYNCYRQVPPLEVEAQAHKVTVFLRSRAQGAFAHNHAYWDHVELIDLDDEGGGTGWRYPVIAEGSKLGVHGIFNPGAEVLGGPDGIDVSYSVVKAVADLSWLPEVKEEHPETIIVGRLIPEHGLEGCPHVEDPATDLDEMANALMSYILNELSLRPHLRDVVDYWEVVNEPDPPGVEGDETQGYRRLAELMIKCMERAETYDLNLALFSLNNGTPEWNEMEAMVETGVFAHAQEGGHIMALHEGVAGANEPIDLGWGQGIPGAPEVPGAGTLNFRYRFLYHLLQQRNEVVPLIISEWYCGRYEEPAQEVVEAVSWYDEKGAEDYWLLGHCPFTVGPTSEWEEKGADYTFAYPALRSYMAGISGRQNALPPAGVEGQWVAPQWD